MFYIYKIINDINDKVYIGQTTRTLEERWQGHLARYHSNDSNIHLYNAMHKYGIEHFKMELLDDTAKTKQELDNLEKYYIQLYNSYDEGYNMTLGGDSNPMFSPKSKENHDIICKTDIFRNNVSKGMKEYRENHQFTEEHRRKLSEAASDRIIIINLNTGETKHIKAEELDYYLTLGYIRVKKDNNNNQLSKKKNNNVKNSTPNAKRIRTAPTDTRSIGCYCIIDTGERYNFHSYLEAGLWWFNTYKPWGDTYSDATFQRKIKQSIAGKEIIYSSFENGTRVKKIITNIKWYKMKEGDE